MKFLLYIICGEVSSSNSNSNTDRELVKSMSRIIVSRFGGDEAANSQEIKKAAEVLASDPARQYAIVSAPGSMPGSVGVTDMLYLCHSRFMNRENYDDILDRISDRFNEIVQGLGINFNVREEIDVIRKSIDMGMALDFVASRGEYITARIFAEYLGWNFIDAAEIIFFNKDGTPDREKTFRAAGERLKPMPHTIIPSFYGTAYNGNIKTFVRGDCDSAGALVACSVNAEIFEKWSEAAKVFSADPSVIPNPELIHDITYMEALELNYVGMNLVTDNVVFMLNEAGIPMRIASTHDPDDSGMLISPKLPEDVNRKVTACIAGSRNFTTIHIRKYGLNKDYAFNEKLFGIFARQHIPCQLSLSGIHQMSVILKSPVFDIRRNQIIGELQSELAPESLTVEKGLAVIFVIGEGMGTVKGIFGTIFDALVGAFVKAKMVEQGADQQNIMIGVSGSDYETAVEALYNALIVN